MANEKKNRRNPAKNLADCVFCLSASLKFFGTSQQKKSGVVVSGKWRVESGEWKVESGEWKVESGKWEVESGKWRVESGEWEVESGKWRVESGEWKVDIPRGVLSPLGHTPVAYTVIPLWAAAHSYLSVSLSVCVCPRL